MTVPPGFVNVPWMGVVVRGTFEIAAGPPASDGSVNAGSAIAAPEARGIVEAKSREYRKPTASNAALPASGGRPVQGLPV